MSLVEAAMCARPMVSCEIGTGTSFINLDGVTGWTVPPQDPDALRDALHKLQEHPETAATMGNAARRRFEDLFTAQKMVRAYRDAYCELVEMASASRRG